MTLNLKYCERDPVHEREGRMTASAFKAALHEIGYGVREFASFTGANPRTVRRWNDGELDIPPWVGVMIALMRAALVFDEETDVRHIDGNPLNNSIENLTIVKRKA